MADNVFNNGGADGLLSTDANFSLAHTPTGAETLVLDSAVSDANLTFDENLPVAGAIDGIRFDNAYAGTVDAATFGVDLGSDGLDCTGGGSATILGGSGVWTVDGGTCDVADIGTWTRETSTINLAGVSTLITKDPHFFHNLTIAPAATVTVTSGKPQTYNKTAINGSLSLSAGVIWEAQSGGTDMGDGATLTGDGTFRHYGHLGDDFTRVGTTTIDVAQIQFRTITSAAVIAAGTYGSALTLLLATATECDWTVSAGAYSFANLQLWATSSGDVTLDLVANPTFTVTGNMTFTLTSSGDAIILPGANGLIFQGDVTDGRTSTGIVTANDCPVTGTGTNSVNWDGCGATWGVTIINKAAGTVTLDDDWTCSDFTGTDGDLDLNSQTLTASGAVSFASGFTVADLADSTIACDTFAADGQTLTATSSYEVTGALVPDVTGTYEYTGMVNGEPYYKWMGGLIYLSFNTNGLWQICGGVAGAPCPGSIGWFRAGAAGIAGTYTPIGGVSGVPTVAVIPWYLNAITSGTATGTTFTNCDASGGVEIDASDGTCTDGGGNDNINFGGSSSSSSDSSFSSVSSSSSTSSLTSSSSSSSLTSSVSTGIVDHPDEATVADSGPSSVVVSDTGPSSAVITATGPSSKTISKVV